MQLYEYELDGKKVIFHSESKIEIQIGKGKSRYRSRHTFSPDKFGSAVMIYNGINIGNGFKKRLVCFTLNKPVLARRISL